MPDIEVSESNGKIVVRAELPTLKTKTMLQVIKATFKDGLLEVVMAPSDQKAPPAPTHGDVKPVKIFPE
jgi:HSP20 family molecular chaperone IbpA